MPGLYTLVATRVDGETLTAAKYNSDEQNHIDNQELQKTDDFSSSVGQMQTTADPGEAGSESLATDASGELARLRFAIKDTKDALGTTVPQWYSTPATISGLVATQGVRNLVLNGDLEDWRNGAAVAPFGWTLSGAGATVARNGTNFKTGTFAASLTRVGTDAVLAREATVEAGGQAYIRSRAYRFSAWVRATVAGRVRLRIDDGISSSFSSYHTGGGAFERLSVTRTLDAAATSISAVLSVDTGDTTGQIDTAMLTEGTAEVAFTLRGETSLFRQVFTATGTYTPSPGTTAVRVLCVGSGGKGGDATTTAAGSVSAGGGGGAGSVAEEYLGRQAFGATVAVTVAADVDASFGALVIGKAGTVGVNGTNNAFGAGGARGVAGTGGTTRRGLDGAAATGTPDVSATSGQGGGSELDFQNVPSVSSTSNGVAAPANTGKGGGGAARIAAGAGTNTGGASGTGLVVVWETLVL